MLKLLRRFYDYQGYNALGSQNYTKAASYFRRVAAAYPDEQGVNYNLAVSLAGAGSCTEAIYYLRQELEVSGPVYNVLRALGEISFSSGRREDARRYLKQAIELAGESEDALKLKQLYRATGDKTLYEKSMRGRELFELGVSQMDAGHFVEARELYNQSLQYDQGNALIYNNLGVIALNHDHDAGQAEEYFLKAIECEDLPIFRMNLRKARSS